ncbi:MAG: hypothetical protein CM15mV22_0070 [Eurybiavirus sp.]|nr:MAG: hypothetical protein CM15mV22_0070 [Eurybiavirus sp.]
MWVVKQPFDLGMKVDTKEKRINTDLTQKAYDDYFHVGERWLEGEYPEIQFKLNYVFWTNEKDVWVEQIPHPLLSRQGFEVVLKYISYIILAQTSGGWSKNIRHRCQPSIEERDTIILFKIKRW